MRQCIDWFGKDGLPGSKFMEDMEPEMYLYLYYTWLEKEEEQHKMAKNYSILIGSFSNPEMAKKITEKENPYAEMADEDFEKLSKEIDDLPPLQSDKPKKKKRKIKQ